MTLKLFHLWQCPYSAHVRDFIAQNGLKRAISYVEVQEVEGAEEQLEAATGKRQVPCLMVDGRPLLESNEIIHWIKTNLVESPDQSWAR